MLLIFSCFYTLAFAAEPTTIKVGLESIYKNVGEITLSSDENLEIGHFNDWGFDKIGELASKSVRVSKSNAMYYDLGTSYNSFDMAYDAAKQYGNGAVPAYIQQGVYRVYTLQNGTGLSPAVQGEKRIAIYDLSNNLLLVSEQNDNGLVFRGYDQVSGLSLTTVGNSKKYRGAIGIGGTTGLTPYNIVDIESYLYGVVPGEMSPSWPKEALKAQAVAARSIAIYQYNRYKNSGYNVVDTTATQVYGGYSKEDARSNIAVDETRGEVIKYNGKVAEALYFSTSGGYTEDAKYVWGNEIPYLKSVADIYETEPSQPAWTRTMTLSEIDACLKKQGVSIGAAQGIKIINRTDSGRVQELQVLGTTGSYTVNNENIRTFFSASNEGSLKSRLFSFKGAIGSVGGGSSGTTSSKVAVLSSQGVVEKEVQDLVAISSTGSFIVSSPITVQSVSGQSVLTSSVQSGSNSNLGSETVYGDMIIYGVGYGHGVGMSQSGAKGMAKAGFSYQEILKYYYSDVTVE